MTPFKAFTWFCLIIGLFACTEEQKKEEDTSQEELKKEAEAPMREAKQRAYYPIPSPEQMFGFINDAGIAYSKDLVNDPDKFDKYTDPRRQALNFGVYTADLAYAAAYQDIESAIDLYKVVKRMSSDLNIEEMMSEEMLAQVQQNLQDPDSLAVIAGRSYYDAVDYLEENGQQGKLALMSLGGWVESLYITMNSLKKFDPESATVRRIADQKITFGNLYTFLRKNEEESGVSDALENIQEIRAVFGSLKEERKARAGLNKENGKLVLGGGSTITMNESQFNQLKTAITHYRNKITSVSA
jgi:hypothetical protein